LTLLIYNSLTKKKEPFTPLHPPKVGMYVCGVTVYDYCHLGHARALVNFDVMYRYLQQSGYQVTYVRNYTDVDDKIIARAHKENISWKEVADKYIQAFDKDMESLGNKKPSVEPRATDNINEILKVIRSLVEKKFAYCVGSDVFYAVRKKKDYGKLSGKKIEELAVGVRVEIHEGKKDPLDFALWKASKEGEPAWDSPWGPGRPGWHIECSAMSMKNLGPSFDIHGGGRDLIFPHHENEIAQSEAYSGKPFAHCWIHNGFVNINTEKMSKSLGNFLTIREMLNRYHPEVIRLFILSAHYRSPLDYTNKNFQMADQTLSRWYTTMSRIHEGLSKKQNSQQKNEQTLQNKINNLGDDFKKAMDDDFNTAKVVGILFDLIRDWNKMLDRQKGLSSSVYRVFIKTIGEIHQVLGIFGLKPADYFSAKKTALLKKSSMTPGEIEEKIRDRKKARESQCLVILFCCDGSYCPSSNSLPSSCKTKPLFCCGLNVHLIFF